MNIQLTKLLGCIALCFVGLCPTGLAAESINVDAVDGYIQVSDKFEIARFSPNTTFDLSSRALLDDMLRPGFSQRLHPKASMDSISEIEWIEPTLSDQYLVVNDSPTWLAAEFRNDGTQELDLMLEKFGLGLVKWYLVDQTGDVVSHEDDLGEARAGRPVFDVGSVIPVRLAPGESVQVYVELTVFSSANWRMYLWNADAFRAQKLEAMMLDGLYFGLLLTLVLFCLIVFVNIREPAYLLFGLFLMSCGATVFFGAGLHNQFFLQAYFAESFALLILSSGFVDLFAALFSITLLRIYQRNTVLFRAWVVLMIVNMFVAIYGVNVTAYGGAEESKVAVLTIAAMVVGLLEQFVYFWTLVSFWYSSTLARYWFLMIFTHTAMFLLWSVAAADPTIVNIDPKRLIQMVTVFEAVMICILLAYMYRLERSERLTAQELSVENLRLARDIEKAKANFVSTVSHDLHGPVRAISFFAESLRAETSDRGRLGIQRIEENVETVSTMLESLVRFSEADSHVQLSIEEVELSQILYTLKNEFDPIARLKTVALKIPSSRLRIETDPVALSQILRNLLDNALKYTDVGVVELLVEEKDQHVWISISDTGRGISGTELERVFDEFYQVSKRDSEGVGLGLSIVARLTKLMGIEVHLNSSVSEGSVFEVVVPKSFPAERLSQSSSRSVGDTIDLSVGIVDIASPELAQVLSQFRNWQLTLTSEPGDFDEVDFLAATIANHGAELIARHNEKPVFLFGEEKGFMPPSSRFVVLPTDVEPMKLRGSLQKVLRSKQS